MAPAAEAMARMSWGSIAWAGAGAASVTIPTITSTTATSWNQAAWRSMFPSICHRDFPPTKEIAPPALARLEDRDRIDRRARHVLETQRRHRHQDLPPVEAGRGPGQLLE